MKSNGEHIYKFARVPISLQAFLKAVRERRGAFDRTLESNSKSNGGGDDGPEQSKPTRCECLTRGEAQPSGEQHCGGQACGRAVQARASEDGANCSESIGNGGSSAGVVGAAMGMASRKRKRIMEFERQEARRLRKAEKVKQRMAEKEKERQVRREALLKLRDGARAELSLRTEEVEKLKKRREEVSSAKRQLMAELKKTLEDEEKEKREKERKAAAEASNRQTSGSTSAHPPRLPSTGYSDPRKAVRLDPVIPKREDGWAGYPPQPSLGAPPPPPPLPPPSLCDRDKQDIRNKCEKEERTGKGWGERSARGWGDYPKERPMFDSGRRDRERDKDRDREHLEQQGMKDYKDHERDRPSKDKDNGSTRMSSTKLPHGPMQRREGPFCRVPAHPLARRSTGFSSPSTGGLPPHLLRGGPVGSAFSYGMGGMGDFPTGSSHLPPHMKGQMVLVDPSSSISPNRRDQRLSGVANDRHKGSRVDYSQSSHNSRSQGGRNPYG